jgi:hypothetical protein
MSDQIQQTQPGWGQPGYVAPQPPKPKHKKGLGRVAFAVYGVLVGVVLANAFGAGDDTSTVASSDPKPAPTVTVTVAPPPKPAAKPKATPKKTEAPKPKAKPKATKKAAPKVEKPKGRWYKPLSPRQWQLIAKDPDAHMGEAYTVYGVITQFDSATGTDTFRADVDATHHTDDFDYSLDGVNTILTGYESDFDNFVQDDEFKAKVTILGSLSYETQIGGETNVPQLMVDDIELIK